MHVLRFFGEIFNKVRSALRLSTETDSDATGNTRYVPDKSTPQSGVVCPCPEIKRDWLSNQLKRLRVKCSIYCASLGTILATCVAFCCVFGVGFILGHVIHSHKRTSHGYQPHNSRIEYGEYTAETTMEATTTIDPYDWWPFRPGPYPNGRPYPPGPPFRPGPDPFDDYFPGRHPWDRRGPDRGQNSTDPQRRHDMEMELWYMRHGPMSMRRRYPPGRKNPGPDPFDDYFPGRYPWDRRGPDTTTKINHPTSVTSIITSDVCYMDRKLVVPIAGTLSSVTVLLLIGTILHLGYKVYSLEAIEHATQHSTGLDGKLKVPVCGRCSQGRYGLLLGLGIVVVVIVATTVMFTTKRDLQSTEGSSDIDEEEKLSHLTIIIIMLLIIIAIIVLVMLFGGGYMLWRIAVLARKMNNLKHQNMIEINL